MVNENKLLYCRITCSHRQTYFKNGENSLETLRKLRTIFGWSNEPDSSTIIQQIIEKFEQSDSVTDIKILKP